MSAITIEISGRRQWGVGVDREDAGPLYSRHNRIGIDGDDGDKEGDRIP